MIYQFGNFELDTRSYQLRNDGSNIELEPKVFDLLSYLIMNREKLVTRDELFEKLWSGQVVSETSLSNQIKAARKAIGDDGKNQSIIKTAHGKGYQFIAGVDEMESQASPAWKNHRQIALEKAGDSRPSIAVLPFSNLNGNPDQEYICDGITEDILIGLCRFHSLLVISRGSVFLYKGKSVDSLEVAEKLGAEYLLEGSVRIAGDRVRITAELVDGASGNDLWAETYDRVLDDVFSVQDDVTQRIISTLATRLEKAGREAAIRKSRASLTLHDLLLRARHYYPEWHGTRDGILQARKLYNQALEIDPDCAAAYSGLACTYNIEYISDWSNDRETAGERSFEYSRKALSLDDRDSNAHIVLGCAYRDVKSNLDFAEKHINKAINANPNDYWHYCCKSNLLTITGRYSESIECSYEAIRRSPLLPDKCIASIGFAEYFTQRYENALVSFGGALNPEPQIWAYIAACYAQIDRMDDASIASDTFRNQNRENPMIKSSSDPQSWKEFWSRVWHFRDPAIVDHLLDGLRKAGIVY